MNKEITMAEYIKAVTAPKASFTQLIRFAGHDINFSDIDPDLLMLSTIQAAGGVTDNLVVLFYASIID